MWKDFGSVFTPALLVPTLTALFPRWRMRPRFALAALVGAATVGGGWLALSKATGGPWLGVEAIYVGLGAGVACFVADRGTRSAPGSSPVRGGRAPSAGPGSQAANMR